MRAARAAALALLFGVPAAFAPSTSSGQGYPSKPIRIIVPFAPGGGTDIMTRIMLPKLTEILKQQVIVDNRPGAGSQIGSDLVAKAPPDGYTVLMVDTAFMTNPSLYSKLPYNSQRDFAPVSLAATAPVIMIVHPSVPVRTVKELVSLARERPGALNFASGGPGSSTHLGVELLKYVAKIDLVHIPYKGTGPAVADVLGGQVTMMFAGISSVKQHVEGGRLRAIAVTGEKRSIAMPKVPTFRESGMAQVEASSYWGTLAPARTPQDAINRLSAAMAQVLKMPDVREKLVELGFEPIGGGPSEYAALLTKETEKWAKVIKAAGVKLD
ncbi:MAG TPA: tripartite tricarboxylate transporter substrate binding protein [Burkholderiales bacterium]|nr:tripartite tricarboxylate transporter substrate binding protein [Burkholderiales bacterium]